MEPTNERPKVSAENEINTNALSSRSESGVQIKQDDGSSYIFCLCLYIFDYLSYILPSYGVGLITVYMFVKFGTLQGQEELIRPNGSRYRRGPRCGFVDEFVDCLYGNTARQKAHPQTIGGLGDPFLQYCSRTMTSLQKTSRPKILKIKVNF